MHRLVCFQVYATITSVAFLLLFYAASLPHMDFRANAVPRGLFPGGGFAVLQCVPYGLWMYLGIEELPLATNEAIEPTRSIPRGLMLGMATLAVLGLLTLVCCASVSPGTEGLAVSTVCLSPTEALGPSMLYL